MTRRPDTGKRRLVWTFEETRRCVDCGQEYLAFRRNTQRCVPCRQDRVRARARQTKRAAKKRDPASQAAAHNASRKNRGQQWASPTLLGNRRRPMLEAQVCACGAVALYFIHRTFYCQTCKP